MRRRAELVLLLVLGDRVLQTLLVGECHANLDAVGRRDPALRLDVLPRGVVALGSDEAEHVALTAVLTHEGRGQTESTPRLQVGGHAEHGRRQQVHLVVDDEAPVAGVEQIEILVLALRLSRHHLIGRDGDGTNLLALTRILADLLLGERRTRDELTLPLPSRNGIRHQDERRRLRFGHRRGTDHRLARATGEHDDARAARPERVGCHLLVVPQVPLLLLQLDRMCLAVDIAREILRGPAHLQQHLLEPTALRRMHHDGVVVDPRTEHGRDLLVAQDLLEHRAVEAHERQPVNRTLHQLQPPEPAHRVDDVHEQRLRDGIPRKRHEGVDNLLGVMPGRTRIPERQRRHPIGVDVLGSALEFGKGGDRTARCRGVGVIHLEEQRLVGLHDQGSISHPRHCIRLYLRGWWLRIHQPTLPAMSVK